MQQLKQWGFKITFLMWSWWWTLTAWADLPTPPSNEQIGNGNDTVQVGSTIIFNVLKVACYATGVFMMLGVAGMMVSAYKVAHEKQDLGHFFKMLMIGLVVITIGIVLLYTGYTIIPSSSMST